MINISTTLVMVLSEDFKLVSRINAIKKFLPENQKKILVLNKAGQQDPMQSEEIKNATGINLCSRIPFIDERQRNFLKVGKKITDIIDLRQYTDDLINSIF